MNSTLTIPTKISIALLALYTFSIGIEELVTIPLAGNKVQVPEIIFLVYAFSILINIRKMSFKDFEINKIDIAIVLYFLAVAFSFLVNRTHNSFGELLGIVYLSGLYVLTKLLIISCYEIYPKIKEFVWKAAILGAITAVCFGFLGYILFYIDGRVEYIWYYKGYPFLGDSIRIKGTVSNPITFCDYLISLVILLIPSATSDFRFQISENSWTSNIKGPLSISDKKTKIGLLAFLILGIIATKTKALILLFSSVLIYFTREKTNFWTKWSARSIAISGVVFYLFVSHFMISPANSDDLTHNHSFSSNSIVYKNDVFLVTPTTYAVLKQSALLAFASSPIVGIGGNELIKFNKILFDKKIITVDPDCAPHSTYFGALGELGLLGFAALLFLLYVIYQQIIKSSNRAIYLCLFGFIIFEMVTVDLMTFRTYWLMLAFLATENYPFKRTL